MYHYTGCGLRNIWLKNGYEHWNTPYGKGVAIADLEGLHRAIGLALVQHKPRLSGAEVRFLRSELDFSQSDLAKVLGVGETSVRGWEKHRTASPCPQSGYSVLCIESMCQAMAPSGKWWTPSAA